MLGAIIKEMRRRRKLKMAFIKVIIESCTRYKRILTKWYMFYSIQWRLTVA